MGIILSLLRYFITSSRPISPPAQNQASEEPTQTQSSEDSSSKAKLRQKSTQIRLRQQLFANASNFSLDGCEFTTIGGNYFDNRTQTTSQAELQQLLFRLWRQSQADQAISQSVGYSRANGITIVDAFGARFVLPKELVQVHSDVHDNLLKYFRGKLGERRVIEKEYCLTAEGTGALVKPEDWNQVMDSGEAVVMNVLAKRVWVESMKEVSCPQCGRTRLGTYKDNGSWVCRRCNKHFTGTLRPEEESASPPSRDGGIIKFKHVRNVFTKKLLRRFAFAARREEALLLELAERAFRELEARLRAEEREELEARQQWDEAITQEANRFEEIID